MAANRSLRARTIAVLPHGGSLPEVEFERRHRMLVWLVWGCAVGLPLYGLSRGFGVVHTLGHVAGLVVFALASHRVGCSRRFRAVSCSLGLLAAAALGVHVSGGLIQAHFSFFVVVIALTLYEDWAIFGLAIAYVLVHHGLMGMFDPHGVFNRAAEYAHPWMWASIHAVFVAAAAAAAVFVWGLNERLRLRMQETQAELERAATTDALTGLGNRRALMADLQAAAGPACEEPVLLTMYDLDGFKPYNDTFGHQAGDALLARLGRSLAEAAAPEGTAYRLGGDEFCVLAPGGSAHVATLEAITAPALADHGEGFSITASLGTVALPYDAASPEEALRIADQRMYLRKTGGRPSAGTQSKDVLLRALSERHPDLGHDLTDLAALAEQIAIDLGLTGEDVERTRHAAELHDIGKVAIPEAILTKPGALDTAEWEFMRRHTLIGERIIAAAPALAQVARIVRSTHERFDGTGYPDQLAGEQIPLPARIVAVCDAFDAMVKERPYKNARNIDDALTELKRCAGTQFDPTIVTAFTTHMTSDATLAA